MINVSDTTLDEIKTHVMFSSIFPENLALYEIMWKNIVQPYRPQMTVWHGACALHAGYPRLQNTPNICGWFGSG